MIYDKLFQDGVKVERMAEVSVFPIGILNTNGKKKKKKLIKGAGGRAVWVDGGATNLGSTDEFVWCPAACLPATPQIH